MKNKLIKIRNASVSDAPSLCNLLKQLGYSPNINEVSDTLNSYSCKDRAVLVAERESGFLGFISYATIPLFHEKGTMGRITAFCVDEKSRNQGIGRMLLEKAEENLSDCAIIEITSGNRPERDAAHKFYKNNGYLEYSGKRFVKKKWGS